MVVKISRLSPPACGRGNRATRVVPPEEDLPLPPGTGTAFKLGVPMEDLTHTNTFVCADGEPCRLYRPGHHIHAIHWSAARRSPEFLRDAIVRAVEGNRVEVEYLDGRSETYWNHENLAALLSPGVPVSIHTQFHLLVVGMRSFNVAAEPL